MPGGVQTKPTLGGKPTGGQLRNVEQSMPADANEFCAAPSQEVAGRLPDARRVREQTEAHRAPLPLVLEYPPESDEKRQERSQCLDTRGVRQISWLACERQSRRPEKDDHSDQQELRAQEKPAAGNEPAAQWLAAERVVTERKSGCRRQREDRKKQGHQEFANRLQRDTRERDAGVAIELAVAHLDHPAPARTRRRKCRIADARDNKPLRVRSQTIQTGSVLKKPRISAARQVPLGVGNDTRDDDSLPSDLRSASEDGRIAAVPALPGRAAEEEPARFL